jgi:hypothetical protein
MIAQQGCHSAEEYVMRRFLSQLTRSLRRSHTTRPGRAASRACLRVEVLEARQLLTGFIGSINSPTTIPASLIDPIQAEYLATARETTADGRNVQQVLGLATSAEENVPWLTGARMQTYQGGTIYWSGSNSDPAHVVYGAIGQKYDSLGDAGGLRFLFQGDRFPFAFTWVTLAPGYGLPTSDETNVAGMPGVRVQTFMDGVICSSGLGAFAVSGAFDIEYEGNAPYESTALGGTVQTALGAPTGDATSVPAVAGASQQTFVGGTLYWSGAANDYAHAVFGAIGQKYADMGGPASSLGLPTADEEVIPGGREQFFQYGKIVCSSDGVRAIINGPSMIFKSGYIGFADDTPVGGWVQMTVSSDGSFDIKGHFHDSGFFSQPIEGTITLWSPSGQHWARPFSGFMGGTFSTVSRDYDFELTGNDAALASNWADFEGGQMRTSLTVGDSQTTGTYNPYYDEQTTEAFDPAVNGYAVTLDASALGVPTVSVDGVPCDASAPYRVNLVPGAHTLTTNGSDVASFTVNADGTVGSASGALTGSGSTLVVNGFAVTLDPTALGVAGLALDGRPLDGTAPSTVNLLPGQHTLTTNGTDVTMFTVNPDGTVSYDPALEGALTGSGTTALAVNGYAVALDGTTLGVGAIIVDGVSHAAGSAFTVNLLPGQHSLTTNGTDVSSFTVNADGTISYDPSLEGALTGSGTTALSVNGYAVTLDASALGVPNLWVDGTAYDASAPLSVNLLPGQHSLSTDGTNVIWFTVNADGTVTYDPSLAGVLAGSGTTSLVFQGP